MAEQAPSGQAALFAALNKGTDITSGLKNIDRKALKKEQEQAGPPVSAPSAPASAKVTASTVVKVEPVLVGDKWQLEGMQNVADPVPVKITKLSQSLMAYKCLKSGIHVDGKVNAVVLNECKRLKLWVSDVISSIELINCANIHVYASGKVGTFSIEKSDDVQLHLSPETITALNGGKDLRVITCKAANVNVVLVQPDGDEKELSVPQQFTTYIENGKLITQASESVGSS